MKLLSLILLFLFSIGRSQDMPDSGFKVTKGKKVEIKFQLVQNLILIPINVNGVELTFLLDSGVTETLLFSLDNKKVDLKNLSKIKFSGLGDSNEVEGLESVHNHLKIADNLEDFDHTIFIILDEDIDISEHLGVPVNGIIGYSFFKDHPIFIDFIKKRITVYKELPRISRSYQKSPITIEGHKPYLQANVELTNKGEDSKLLMDLGNSDAIWLFPYVGEKYITSHPFIEDYLGSGFNGDIMGKRGRIHHFSLGKFSFEKPLVVVPDSISIQNLHIVPQRKGSIGNEIFRRFKMLIDYPRNALYLKRNNNFDDPFLFNKSGIEIKQHGFIWEKDLVPVEAKAKEPTNPEAGNKIQIVATEFQYKFVLKPAFVISNCRQSSPCDKVGLLKGDQLISINGRKVSDFSLEKINRTLTEGKDGTTVSLEIQRSDKIYNVSIVLQDPIPYHDTANP